MLLGLSMAPAHPVGLFLFAGGAILAIRALRSSHSRNTRILADIEGNFGKKAQELAALLEECRLRFAANASPRAKAS